jgi:hypothetical protein
MNEYKELITINKLNLEKNESSKLIIVIKVRARTVSELKILFRS